MITVALITTRFIRQGPNKQLLYLIRNIDKTKIKPIVITIAPEREPSLINEFKSENIDIIQLDLSFWASLFKGRSIIDKLISSKNIDVVHSFTYATRVEYIIHKLKGVIKLATIRNSPRQSRLGYFGNIGGYIIYYLQMHFYRNMSYIIACSRSIFELPELKKLNKIAIPNGIDVNIVKNINSEEDKYSIRQKLGLPIKERIFITISNATPIKNIEFLISYFKKNNNLTLVVSGNIAEEYKTLIGSSKNIIFTGHVEKIYEYYKAADCFISASYSEGLPNAVLESLLLGTPCILSDIPMHREIIEKSTNYIGAIFKNDDIPELAKKIEQHLQSININTSNNCSQFINENFSAKQMAKKYENFYISLCNNLNIK